MPRHTKSRQSSRSSDTQSNRPPCAIHPLHDFPARVPDEPAGARCGRKKVLIVHGVPLTRFGISALLSAHAQFEVCGTAQSVPMARALFVQERPDLVVIGLALGGGEGIQLIKDFATLDSDARTIVFSAHEDRRSIERAFRAGAFGYLVAHDDLSEIVTALEHVATGECYASAAVLGRLLERSSRVERRQNVWERLSDRERQVFSLIGRGFGVTRLAAELHLSVKTIETHQQRIKEKLGLHSAGEVSEKASAVMLHSLHRNLQLRNEMLGRRNDN